MGKEKFEISLFIINFQTNTRVVNPTASYRVAVSADDLNQGRKPPVNLDPTPPPRQPDVMATFSEIYFKILIFRLLLVSKLLLVLMKMESLSVG